MDLTRRMIVGAILVLQSFVSVVGPVSEARAQVVEAGHEAHVEAPDASDCHSGHEDHLCQLCRALSITGVFTPPLALPLPSAVRLAGESQPNPSVRTLGSHGPVLGPRGPPLG